MLAALRSRDFRLLWLSQSASVLGDSLVVVAIGIFVTRLTHHPSDVGLILGAYTLPLVAFVLVGGVLADRLPRQLVMIASDAVRMVVHGALALLIATGAVRVWHMAVIGVLFGTAQAFFQPAYTGLVPQTVVEADIASAQALGGFSRELGILAGPGLATALVLGAGADYVFGVDAVTFAVSVALLSRIRTRDRGGGPAARTGVLAELREGWSAVRARAWVWATVAVFSVSLMVGLAPFFVLGAAVARHRYGTDAVYGFANVAWGVGTVSGALAGAAWRPRRPMRAAMLAILPWPLAVALYGLGIPLPLMYVGMAVGGVGSGLFGVWWETALAQRIPPHLLSRVSAWDWMGSLCLLPAGYLLAGPAAEAVGATTVLAGGAFIALLLLSAGLLPSSTRHLTRLEETAPAVDLLVM